ncbi:glycosyltransferase [Candidatus Accumulibacter aalborgensis]|uniref:glycosyltransferase n=1 Tax=Candidatus Accumulibacter aalborgensis TaxID=1860102 RepID=UPI0016495FB1|nr:glycosyltransferase [Candidatus Accumulibacter aalborgensis]
MHEDVPLSPLVSILIRSINRLSLLHEALASVARQTYSRIEILVVAAVPNHAELGANCGPYPLRLIPTDHPLHRCRAANAALDAASGAYLLILDDDDWLLPDHVEKLASALTDDPELLAAYTGVQPTDADGESQGGPIDLPFDELRLLAGNLMPPHAVLFRHDVIDLGCRFDESIDLFEDWDFWQQIARHSTFAHVPGVSAYYRIHASSGVHEIVPFVSPEYARLYGKWRHLWREGQIAGMMARVWDYPDQKARVTEQHGRIVEQQRVIVGLEQRTLELEWEIQAREQLLDERHRHIEAIWRSSSWRITKPLRGARKAISYGPRLKKALLDPAKVWRFLKRAALHLPKGDYSTWIARFEPPLKSYPRLRQMAESWHRPPTIAVVMPTYRSDVELLEAAIRSVLGQVYPYWQLCIADDASDAPAVKALLERHAAQDARIRVVFRPVNGHISAASNSALALASGDFVALLDHDDLLHPLALWFVAKTCIEHPEASLIYTDEDKLSAAGQRCDPYFKCDFNYELLLAQNMISHLGVYRRSLLSTVGGFREGFEGSQDYDLALRAIECLRPDQIVHIPRVLYHWRIVAGSTASSIGEKPYALTAAHKALSEHLHRRGVAAEVTAAPEIPLHTRVRFSLPTPAPQVSILIPTRDRANLLRLCIGSIRARTTYSPYEIIVIDNGSEDADTLQLLDQLRQSGVRVLRDDGPFNFSRLNNRAVAQARGSVLCLMNNDIEIITPSWLEEMVSVAQQDAIGAVGARLWYPNDRLQHGGIILGVGGVAGHSFLNSARGAVGYFGRAALHQSLSAVTAACMVVRKSVFLEIGGLDERLSVSFNDVDFCLRLRQAGYRNVWTPYAEMFHYESASRGRETTPEKQARFAAEVAFMQDKWSDELLADPAYSPNLTLGAHDFSLAWPPRIAPIT